MLSSLGPRGQLRLAAQPVRNYICELAWDVSEISPKVAQYHLDGRTPCGNLKLILAADEEVGRFGRLSTLSSSGLCQVCGSYTWVPRM